MLEGGGVTTGPYPIHVTHSLDDDSQRLAVVAHPT